MFGSASIVARRGALVALSLGLVSFAAGCGGDTPTGSDPDPDPDPATISIAIDPSSGSVAQGGSLTITGTATLGGDFSGGVTFTVTGLPSGVTISVGSVTTSGNTATAPITVDVDASVSPGTYSGTVMATGSGVSDTVSYSLTVTEAAGFTLASISSISIEQGASGTRDVDIVRTGGFAESVAISVEGAPAGLTATPSPASTTGDVSTITVDADAALATGTYNLTVRGTATGLPDATTTFDVTITAAPAGTQITVDFSVCPVDERPVWLAIEDGVGNGWTRVTGSGDVYTFTVTQGTLGFANVIVFSSGDTDLSVDYFTTAEAVAAAAGNVCDSDISTGKTVDGTVAGILDFTTITMGGASTTPVVDGAFTLNGVADGEQDLVAYTENNSGFDRMVIIRDQDVADGGSVGAVDFNANGFEVDSATITVSGLAGGETGFVRAEYATSSAGSVCSVAPLRTATLASPFTLRSTPPAEQATDEYHVANVTVNTGTTSKTVQEAFQSLADRTVALPADLPTPTLTDVTGSANYLRLQADFTAPAEYDQSLFFDYSETDYTMTVFATAGVMSGAVSLVMPDFSGVAGWDDSWGIPAAATGVEYAVAGLGRTSATPQCTDGGRQVFGGRAGNYN